MRAERLVAGLVVFGFSMGLLAEGADPELERLKKERADLDARIVEREKKPEMPKEGHPESRPVIVTATRLGTTLERSGYSGSVVTNRDIEASGYTEAQEILRTVPGLNFAQTGTRGGPVSLFTRGGESDYTKVLWDGFKVNVDGGAFDFNSLTLDNVDRIEVIRGAASASDGSSAVAGVVNLVSRRGMGPPKFALSTEGGNYGAWRERLRLSGGEAAYGYSIDTALYKQESGRFENAGVENRSFAGRFDFRVNQSTDMWLTVRELRFKAGVYTTGSGPDFDPPDPNDFKTRDDFLTGLTVRKVVDPEIWESQFKLSRYYNTTKITTQADRHLGPGNRDSSDSILTTSYQRAGTDWQNTFAVGEDVRLSAGVEYEGESFDQGFSSSTFGSDTDNSRHNFAEYTEAEWSRDEAASLRVGTRREDNSDFGEEWTHRASGAAFLEDTGTRFHSSYGTGIKVPTFFEIKGSPPGTLGLEHAPDGVGVERSQTVDAGVEQHLFDKTLRVGVTAFYNKYVDLVEFVNSSYDQGARAFARGAEFEIGWTPDRMWDVSGQWTNLGTRVTRTRISSTSFIEGDQLVRRPHNRGSGTVRCRPLENDKLEISLTGSYVGPRDDLDFNTWSSAGFRTKDPNHTTFDAAAAYRFAPGWRLFGSGQNVLNKDYEEIFGFPADRFTYMAGIEYTIDL